MKRIAKLIFIFIIVLIVTACKPNQFIVVFDSDGGSFVADKTVTENDLVIEPDNPTRDNYIFIEWRLNGLRYDFSTPVTSDLTLKAHWEPAGIFYTVTFDLDEGTLVGLVNPQTIVENSVVANPGNPEKPGYAFIEWQVLGIEYDFSTPVTSNLLIKAHYEPTTPTLNQYTVFFKVDGSIYHAVEIEEGSKATAPLNPEKPGYRFIGWILEGTEELFSFNEPITAETTLIAEFKVESDDKTLDIFYINDLHGSILENGAEIGLAKIANLITETKKNNPNTIFIAGGDIFQGGAISNINFGKPIIEIFNEIGVHANILGNHEFDWGLDEVLKYYLEDGIAQHPLLSINTFYKNTENIVEGLDPYTIVDLPDFKVGIIGYIDDLRRSIMASAVEPYVFANPEQYIAEMTTYLREVEKVDYIIVAGHNADTSISNSLSKYDIDFFFEAHSHQTYITSLANNKKVLQAGSNGRFVGHVQYELKEGESFLSAYLLTPASEPLLNAPNPEVAAIIERYVLESQELLKTPIIQNGPFSQSVSTLTLWAARVMQKYYNADIGFHNSGGTRASISANATIDLDLLYKVFPFDNAVVLVELTSQQMSIAQANNNYTGSDFLNIVSGRTYLVAVNQFVYEYDLNVFKQGRLIEYGIEMRQLIVDELMLQAEVYPSFSINNEILIRYEDSLFNYNNKSVLFIDKRNQYFN